MPLGIAIPLIAGSVATQLYGAHKQSQAGKEAARTQSQAADRAMQFQYALAQQAMALQQQQQQQVQAFYGRQGVGGQTLGALARGVGLPYDPPQGLGAGGPGPGGMAPPPSFQLPPPPGSFQLNQPVRPPWLQGGPQSLSSVFAAGGGR